VTSDALQQSTRPQQAQEKDSGAQAKSSPQFQMQTYKDSDVALSGPDKDRRKKIEVALENDLNKKAARALHA